MFRFLLMPVFVFSIVLSFAVSIVADNTVSSKEDNNNIEEGLNNFNNACGDFGTGNPMMDYVFLSNYVAGLGTAPSPLSDGNVDGFGTVNIADAVYYGNYLFAMGPPPSCTAPVGYTPTISNVDTVRIGDPPYTIYPGSDSMAIPIYLSNATTIQGFTFGFEYPNSEISVTSINTSLALVAARGNFLTGDGKIQITYESSMSPISPQIGGLLVKLNAQIVTTGADQGVDIDSAFAPPAGEFIYATSSASIFAPEFIKASSSACCQGIRGNFNGLEEIDIGDIVFMVEYQFLDSGIAPPCFEEGDIAPLPIPDGSIDIGDLVFMAEYQFLDGPPPPDCP